MLSVCACVNIYKVHMLFLIAELFAVGFDDCRPVRKVGSVNFQRQSSVSSATTVSAAISPNAKQQVDITVSCIAVFCCFILCFKI